MTDPHGAANVTRLVDMIVEEVSLVDRAANKHRFLIVKRDDAMAKARGRTTKPNDEDETGAEDEAGASAPPPGKKKRPFPPPKPKAGAKKPKADEEDELDEDEEADDDAPPPPRGRRRGATKEATDPMSALGLTLATLDKLAAAVEAIDGAEAADDEVYVDLARDLRKASIDIAKAAGVELEGEEDEDDDGEDEAGDAGDADAGDAPAEAGDPARGTPADATAGVLTAVRDVLTRIEGVLAPTAAAPAAVAAAGGVATGEVTKGLRELATAVAAIATSMKTQSARLSTLEKRTGLPNSQPPERAPRRRQTSWPFDINRPMDRDSVKKELSFHGDD